jgi:hypothetical protein
MEREEALLWIKHGDSDDAGAGDGDDGRYLKQEVLRQVQLWFASNLWFT